MFIHRLTRESTDEVGLGVVGKREGLGKLIEVLGTDRTLYVELLRLITLTMLDLRRIIQQYSLANTNQLICLARPSTSALLLYLWLCNNYDCLASSLAAC